MDASFSLPSSEIRKKPLPTSEPLPAYTTYPQPQEQEQEASTSVPKFSSLFANQHVTPDRPLVLHVYRTGEEELQLRLADKRTCAYTVRFTDPGAFKLHRGENGNLIGTANAKFRGPYSSAQDIDTVLCSSNTSSTSLPLSGTAADILEMRMRKPARNGLTRPMTEVCLFGRDMSFKRSPKFFSGGQTSLLDNATGKLVALFAHQSASTLDKQGRLRLCDPVDARIAGDKGWTTEMVDAVVLCLMAVQQAELILSRDRRNAFGVASK